ncbi:SMP-30/gluconolactonase/LRE family protein [Cupriavidus sp. 2TAF22]|uniref:SMP-30/gluconolactonase/LRE family protein n=1 Tax=unclassified Cupriavidus TaxID=2640874 RepID=UPI003F92FFB3
MAQRRLSVLTEGHTFLEGPRWHEDRLWLSDFYSQRVIAVSLDGSVEQIAEVPQQPSGLGWLPDGRLLIVSMRDRKLLRREPDGSLAVHADLSAVATGHVNDMVVDRHGRAYVGNFGFDLMAGAPMRTASLARVDPDGTVSVVADGLFFPNGSVITPDGKTLVVGETLGNRISAFDLHDDGSLGPRRDWALFGSQPAGTELAQVLGGARVAPDGCAQDAEGALWVADAIGNRVLRVMPGGHIAEEIACGTGVFAAALGGPHGRTLFLAAAPNFDEAQRRASHLGHVLMTEVEVPHAGLP